MNVEDKKMYFAERASTSDKWTYTTHFGKEMQPAKWAYGATSANGTYALSTFFPLMAWSSSAHDEIGGWIEAAQKHVNR